MFPEKSVRAIYRSEKHTHQLHFLLKSLHLIEKWSNIPYKLVDQSTVVKDMNSPSWHSYDYILSFCILKTNKSKSNERVSFFHVTGIMWITHRVLWSVSCTSNPKINTVNWLHGLFRALKQRHLVCQMYQQHSWLYQRGNSHTKKKRLISFLLNPLSPNGDQHQFSPNNNLFTPCQEIRLWEFMKWLLNRKCFDLLSNSLN